MHQHPDGEAEAEDADGEGDDGDDGAEGFDAGHDLGGLLFFPGHEAGEVFIQGFVDGVLVFQGEGEPRAFKGFPFFGKAFKHFGGGGLETPAGPEGRVVLGPETEDAVVGGHFLDAFPDGFAGGVGEGEVDVVFAVKAGMLAEDLEADGAGEPAVGLDNLEFGEAVLELVAGQAGGGPEVQERGEVVHGGAADGERRHDHDFATNPAGATKNLQFCGVVEPCRDINR